MAAPDMEPQTPTGVAGSEAAALPLPRLEELPEELVSNISHRLDYDDIVSLRLSCRALEARSFHDFATEYFSVKGFIFSSESLKVLKAISENKRLQSYLHNVYITTAYFSEKAFSCPNGCHCAWQPMTRQAEAYRMYMKDQLQLKESGDDLHMLTGALQSLPELTSLHLRDSTRYPEDLDDATPYGVRKITRRCARSPTYSPTSDKKDVEYTRWCTHIWRTMCKAVSESGLCTLTNFGVYINKRNDGLSVSQDLKLGSKTLAGLRKGLMQLKSARLTIRGNSLIKRNGTPDSQASAAAIEKFGSILRQPTLQDLTLSYDNTPASHLIHVALVKNVDLSKIVKLSIDGLNISAAVMATALSGMREVKDLQLSWSNLTKGTWVPVLQAIENMAKLDHLHLMWLQEASRKVYFLTQPELDPDEDWLDDPAADFGQDEDDDDIDSDELPDLEPPPGAEEIVDQPPTSMNAAPQEEAIEFTAPGYEQSPERGYYVCLKGHDDIAKYVPIFIKEYNVGENLDEHYHHPFPHLGGVGGPGGAAGAMPVPPAALNNLMNNLFGAPLPPGAQGGNGGAAAGVNGGGHGNGHGGHAHGPPPPLPGFMTVGGGPGYQMMMGTMPMHGGPPPPFAAGGHADGGHAAGAGAAAAAQQQQHQHAPPAPAQAANVVPPAPVNAANGLNPTVDDETDEDTTGGAPVVQNGGVTAEELLNTVFDSDNGGWSEGEEFEVSSMD